MQREKWKGLRQAIELQQEYNRQQTMEQCGIKVLAQESDANSNENEDETITITHIHMHKHMNNWMAH